jgi:regulator of RNase E activity RraA
MATGLPTAAELAALAAFDTPTICNALEIVAPDRRGNGYTTCPAMCGFPAMKPVVGFARTARIRTRHAPPAPPAELRRARQEYYRYVDDGPKPSLIVIHDLDGPDAGYGAFWGEVQSAIHRGLGARGVITDGSIRDIDQWAPDFQFLAAKVAPSHAFAHVVDFGGEIEVLGMRVRSGDIVHADRHGAVVVPTSTVAALPDAAHLLARREGRILAVARAPGCTAERLMVAIGEADQIH